MFRKLLSEEEFCTPKDVNDKDDVCVRIQDTLKTIDEVTKEINEGTVTQETLDRLNEESDELREVVDEVSQDPAKVAEEYDFKPEKLEEETNKVKDDIDSAIEEVNEQLGTGEPTSNAAVIAVGVIGGVIVVMLIAVGGYMAHKKHQERKKRQNHQAMNDGVLEEAGQNNASFEMESLPSTSQPPPAPIRPVRVLPPVPPRIQPAYSTQGQAGYASDSTARYSSVSPSTSFNSRTSAGASYHPPRSHPRGLRRMDS